MQSSTHHTHTNYETEKIKTQTKKRKEKSDLGRGIYRLLVVLLQDDPEPKSNAIVKRIKH